MRTVNSSPPPPYSPPRRHHTLPHHHHRTSINGHSYSSTSSRRSFSERGAVECRGAPVQHHQEGIVLSAMSQPMVHPPPTYSTLGRSTATTCSDYQEESSFCTNTDTLITRSSNSGSSQTPMYPTVDGRWYRKYCNHRVPAVVVFGVVAAIFSVTYLYMVVVYRLQPTPVVDEAFHIPQAQKYCQGKFNEWDPKLTTLPGLYLFSIGITGPVSWVLGMSPTPSPPTISPADSVTAQSITTVEEGVCSVLMLRLVNVLVAPCILLALHSLLTFMHSSQASEWSCLASSVSLVLLPPLFWFYSLYYTEPLAVMLVLLMLLLYCHECHCMAALIGVVSVVVRQTNIVWVLFLVALRAVDSTLRHLNAISGTTLATLHTVHHVKVLFRRLRRIAQDSVWLPLRLLQLTLKDCGPYVAVLAAFAVFVYVNGGLVVGDRSAHQATIHLTQICYFCLFVVIFSPSLALSSIPGFVALCFKHPKTTVVLLALTVTVIHNNTLVHPYLLADNRHYTFYLWNRLYGRHIYFRYLMAPGYLFGAHLVWNVCLEKRSNIFRLIYLACVVLCVVPQKLLEPRYFILPFLVARLQRSPYQEEVGERRRENRAVGRRGSERTGTRSTARGSNRTLFIAFSSSLTSCYNSFKTKCNQIFSGFPLAHIFWEFLYYLIINLAALAVFGSKTFWWKDFPEPQRIMW